MRAGLLLAGAALAILVVAAVRADAQQTQRVRVSAELVDVREDAKHRADISLIWTRSRRGSPIGHAVLDCRKLGVDGLLGGGVSSCRGIYVLPTGKLVAAGLVHGFERYTLVITGGSGEYEGASGVLFARASALGVEQALVFNYR